MFRSVRYPRCWPDGSDAGRQQRHRVYHEWTPGTLLDLGRCELQIVGLFLRCKRLLPAIWLFQGLPGHGEHHERSYAKRERQDDEGCDAARDVLFLGVLGRFDRRRLACPPRDSFARTLSRLVAFFVTVHKNGCDPRWFRGENVQSGRRVQSVQRLVTRR
ncbi:hypothetical protein MRX96_020129 [Rhipicephalus microplus]